MAILVFAVGGPSFRTHCEVSSDGLAFTSSGGGSTTQPGAMNTGF